MSLAFNPEVAQPFFAQAARGGGGEKGSHTSMRGIQAWGHDQGTGSYCGMALWRGQMYSLNQSRKERGGRRSRRFLLLSG